MRRSSVSILLTACMLGWPHALKSAETEKNFTPRSLAAAIAEGNVAFERKDYGAARNAYSRVLALEPENLMGLVNLGMVEFYSGRPDKAEDLLKRAVRQRLESAPAWLTLGMIYMDRNEPDADAHHEGVEDHRRQVLEQAGQEQQDQTDADGHHQVDHRGHHLHGNELAVDLRGRQGADESLARGIPSRFLDDRVRTAQHLEEP